MNKLIKILTITLLTISATIAGNSHQFIRDGNFWYMDGNVTVWTHNPLTASFVTSSWGEVLSWFNGINEQLNSIEITYSSDRNVSFVIGTSSSYYHRWLPEASNHTITLTSDNMTGHMQGNLVLFEDVVQQEFALSFYIDNIFSGTIANLTVHSLIINTTTQPVQTHTITWRNWDNSLLNNGEHGNPEIYNHGANPSFKGATPTRNPVLEPTLWRTFVFSQWSPVFTAVTSDRTYTAEFNSTVRHSVSLPYTVNFNSSNDLNNWALDRAFWLQSFRELVIGGNGGTAVMPLLPANQTNLRLTVSAFLWEGVEVSVQTSSDGIAWTPQNRLEASNSFYVEATISIPNGTRLIRFVNTNLSTDAYILSVSLTNQTPTHTVTWLNWDESVVAIVDFNHGTMPSFDWPNPARPNSSTHRFEFVGWSPAFSPVMGNQTYTAVYNAIPLDTRLPQEAPFVEVISKTRNSIVLTNIPNAEYVLDGRVQESNVFTGLNAGTFYHFRVRLKETATHTASPFTERWFMTEQLDPDKEILFIAEELLFVDSEKVYDGTRNANVQGITLLSMNPEVFPQVAQLRRDVDFTVTAQYNSPNVSEARYVRVSVELIGDAANRFQFENSSVTVSARIIQKTWEDSNAEITLTLDGQRTTARIPGGTLNLTFFPSTIGLPKIEMPAWMNSAEISWTIIGSNSNNFTWRRWNENTGGGVPAGAGNYYIRVRIAGSENIAAFDERVRLNADFQVFDNNSGGGTRSTDIVRSVAFSRNPVYDNAEIFVETLGNADVRLTILDVLGNTVFSTSARANKNSALPVTVWDLRNRAGQRVGSGIYLVIVEAQDEHGQTYRFTERLGVMVR